MGKIEWRTGTVVSSYIVHLNDVNNVQIFNEDQIALN